jgi:DnaJ-class molecular chaperone
MNMNVRQALQILNVGGGYINIKDIPSAIKTAYRKQALLFHPDKNKSDDAQEVFIEIKTAFDVLTSAYEPTTRFFSLGTTRSATTTNPENLFNGFCYNYNYNSDYVDTDDTDDTTTRIPIREYYSGFKKLLGNDTFTKIQNNIFFYGYR